MTIERSPECRRRARLKASGSGGVSRLGEFFGPDGLLRHGHPTYEPRPGQQAMAEAVFQALTEGGRLMVEAGTGTGKTLAYLAPAVFSGRRVIVSTGTRNLQDQLFLQDIPLLRRLLGGDISAALMKGRDNYLCRWRLAEFERAPLLENLDETPWVERIAAWSRTTTRGDRAEIADLPDGLRVWRDLNARAETCGGAECPEYDACWLTRMKQAAQAARIVVVNHHLFFADLALRTAFGSVLPDYDTVVFDEAHLLESVATLYFGARISSADVEDLARELHRAAERVGSSGTAIAGVGRLRDAARTFFDPLSQRLRQQPGRQRFTPPEQGGPDVEPEWQHLAATLEDVARQAAIFEADGETLARRADDLRLTLQRIVARDDPEFVYGLEARGRGGHVVLSAAPIEIGALLNERLFSGLHACVLTSATLSVEGRFTFFQERLGLQAAETLAVGSPFDPLTQAVLYVPAEMPEPRDPRFLDRAVEEIIGLLEITRGRAFLLFTSHATMQAVHARLATDSRWTLLLQGSGSKPALVETFRHAERAVLLGTTSFWHGVDVAGEALSLVVIDKLPFDAPNDPLIAARIEHLRQRGEQPFTAYQLPLAVIDLKQGLGRLLRRRSDRGILAVLDPRLCTRHYGRTFLASLPAHRLVRARAECAAFFDSTSTPS